MFVKKLILTTLVHLVWIFVILLSGVVLLSHSPLLFIILNKPYMVLIVYPVVANIIVYRIRTKNPLPDKEQDRKLKKINLVYTVLILLLCLPYAGACLISFILR